MSSIDPLRLCFYCLQDTDSPRYYRERNGDALLVLCPNCAKTRPSGLRRHFRSIGYAAAYGLRASVIKTIQEERDGTDV